MTKNQVVYCLHFNVSSVYIFNSFRCKAFNGFGIQNALDPIFPTPNKKKWCFGHMRLTDCCNIICNRAYENQPCERKLHRVIFLLISFIPNALSHLYKPEKKAH